MKKHMLCPLRTLFCSALLLGSLVLPAMAADISVRVDDRPVAFTDVRPILRSDRTFVPFRAIFEQMEAAVSWDGATGTVTAVRDGREVRLQIGQTNVRITENGQTRTVQTDVAPFIENDRTFVPIRFASEALGACVDWVQATRTVLIVDAARLAAADADAYRTMDAYLRFAAPENARAVSGSVSLDLTYKTAMGSLPVRMQGAANGAENNCAAEFAGSVQTDMAALRDAIGKNEGADVLDDTIDALLTRLTNTDYKAILSRTDGTLYLSGTIAEELGAEPDGWLSIPLTALAGDAAALLAAPAQTRFSDVAAQMAQSVSLKDTPDATVAAVRACLDRIKAAYGDAAWQGTTEKTLTAENLSLRLTCGADGTVTAAVLDAASGAYRTTLEQTAGRSALRTSRTGSTASDFTLSLTLDRAAGSTAPAVRPSGTPAVFPFQ